MTNWIKGRLVERTSWDGAALIAIGVIVLVLGPLAHYAAWAALCLLYTSPSPRD